MTSLEIVNKRLYWIKKNKATGVFIEESELEQIKQDLEVLYLLEDYLFSCLSGDKKNIIIGLFDMINRNLSESDKLFIRTWLIKNDLFVFDRGDRRE